MKKNNLFKILILVGFILGISIFLYNSYSVFRNKKNTYSNNIFTAYLYHVHRDFVNKTGKTRFTKKEFEKYLTSSNEVTSDFLDWLKGTDYKITFKNDSIIFYDTGFDNDDDSCGKVYDPDEVNYLESIFINGDVILYEDFANILKNANKK